MDELQIPADESRCQRFIRWVRAAVSFCLSHIGLCGLVVGYSIGGGFMFQALEKDREQLVKKNVTLLVDKFVEELRLYTENLTMLQKEDWEVGADEIMKNFQSSISKYVQKEGYTGQDGTQWSTAEAILYAIIVITTIGYGNVAPRTQWGKIVTILYAIVGIPLMLLCMSNVGDAMARSFKFLYWKVCCFRCAKKTNMQETHLFQGRPRYSSTKRRRFFFQEEQSGDEGSHSSSYRSARSDEFKFAEEMMMQDSAAYFRRGPLPAVILNRYALGNNTDFVVDLPSPTENKSPLSSSQRTSSRKSKAVAAVEENRTVPIWLCVALVTTYLCGGALLFKEWEDDWTFFESFYFCFITLTTIGFGDYVPGKVGSDEQTSNSEKILALCAVYLLFGMALLAMSFNLVQEQVTTHIKRIARRIGIIDDDENEEAIDDNLGEHI
uniref:Potassium channel domain-containing protein n=1 Tax=Strigamia maritima TaxID=126957 RepID=T1IJ90_STRMM